MKSICFIGNFQGFSGALEVFRSIARRCNREGIETAYAYHHHRAGVASPDMSMFDKVIHFADDDLEKLTTGLSLFANRYDVIHTSLVPIRWRWMFKARATKPMVELYHSAAGWSAIWKEYKTRLEIRAEKYPGATVAVSQGLQQLIARDTGQNVRLIFNGVVADYPPSWSGRYVTYCGRLDKGKGLADWMRVAGIVRKEFPGAKFQWVGAGSKDNAEWIECVQLAAPWLEQVGYQEDLTPFWERSAVNLLCSPSEGLPMSILEAGAHGIPSVAFDNGDSREAMAYMARDVEEAASRVIDLLSMTDREPLARFLNIATRERFGVEGMTDKYLSLYRELEGAS